MISKITKDFLQQFRTLPSEIKEQSRRAYTLWKSNPFHPSLRFKRVSRRQPFYSVRIGISYRAVGLLEQNTLYWFWIGTHNEYDELLKYI
ncbi:MAG: hypothetical protein KGZ58_06720 [Ignavibacteriales bacterium]|nr:hypothetical protein [Ignavibacteriales bacterium]